jgi:NAD/NADP transhydrogenase beta subunit
MLHLTPLKSLLLASALALLAATPASAQEKFRVITTFTVIADMAQNVIVVKRGKGTGYSGIENALFYKDNTRLLYGSAQQAIGEVIQHVKAMSV